MKFKLLLLIMATTLSFSCNSNAQKSYPVDKYTTKDGKEISIMFYKHASLGIEADNKHIYVDPVSEFADFDKLPKADIILITHEHSDHFDPAAIKILSNNNTKIICSKSVSDKVTQNHITLEPGDSTNVYGIKIDAIPAYNITPGHTQFHPKSRMDNGYIITIGGSRILIAGDTENTPELKSAKDIDIAFLPVNQPYTMTPAQAQDAIKAIKPKIFYPYHYGQVPNKTDLDELKKLVEPYTEVRIRGME